MSTQRKRVKIAVVGYRSDLGKELKEYIENKELFLDVEFKFYDFSAVDDYSILGSFRGETIVIKYPKVDEFNEFSLVVLTGSSPQNQDFLKSLNTSFILDIKGETNEPYVLTDGLFKKGKGRIYRLAHPLSIIAGKFLIKINSIFKLKSVNIVGLFPASLKDNGIESLFKQTLDVLNMQSKDTEKLGGILAFDFLPPDNVELLSRIEEEIVNIYRIKNVFTSALYIPVFHSITALLFFETVETLKEDIFQYSFDVDETFRIDKRFSIPPSSVSGREGIFISLIRNSREKENLYYTSIVADNYLEGIIKPACEFISNFLKAQND